MGFFIGGIVIHQLSVDPKEMSNGTKISIEDLKDYDVKENQRIAIRISDGSIHGGTAVIHMSRKGARQFINALIEALTQED